MPTSFTGIDKAPEFERYVRATYPQIEYVIGDLFDLSHAAFDIVICSHTIEHVPDPAHFVETCNAIARKFCLFYTPFREQNLINGHMHSIDDEFIRAMPPVLWSCVKRSIGWRPASDQNPRTVLFATVANRNGLAADHAPLRASLDGEYRVFRP